MRTNEQSRLPSLTGLRFVAALMVFLCHTGTSLLPRLESGRPAEYQRFFDSAGPTGVSFFFVLSGFILTWVARPDDSRRSFWRRRLVKIFPSHLVTLAAAVILMLAAGVAVTFANTGPTLLLVQGWIPLQDVILNYGSNTPSWSLACELLFYLAFPWLLVLARRIKAQRLWGWVAATTAGILAIPLLAQLLPAEPYMPLTTDSWWATWFTYYFPGTRLLEFVLGILMALVVLNKRWTGLRPATALLLAAAAFVGGAYLPGVYSSVAPTALPLALVIAAVATADVRGRRTLFDNKAAIWLGEISYAFYMVHFLVVSYGPIGAIHPENWAKPLSVGAALALAGWTLVISLVLAWLLHVLVENPAMRRWSRSAAARTPEPAPVPVRGAEEPVRAPASAP
ncbi:acyltransferase family protein [Streptomyces sp. cmx-18-6]|uniref:acyltransferase family protein n=1 Tax=Streptomyces sp. cmx-18-6 TaxID=2790930 RepID=UPI00397F5137